MRKISVLIFCLMLTNTLFSQNRDANQLDKEKKNKIADAHYLYLNEEYAKAVIAFKDLVRDEPDNANFNYLTGLCFLKLPFENGRSIPYLTKAVQNLTFDYKEGSYKETKAPINALYWLGYAYHLNKGYTLAQMYYKRYRDTLPVTEIYNIRMVERQMESCLNAKELSKHPVEVEINNLGNYINSPRGDINPCVNGNGTMIVYTRVRDKKAKDTINLSVYSRKDYQILEAFCDTSGRWSKPIDISEQLNTRGYFKSLSLSSDGTELLLFRDDLDNGGPLSYKNGSIYYSKKTGNIWSPVRILNSNINSVAWESHAVISPDGKEIYFTSDRKGGYGGLDIYVSQLKNGDWGPAKNLGPTINTQYDEETPVILPDGKTLYFSSEGHYNMGGYDIFYSTKLDSDKWSEPINVGYPINSTDDNLFFVPIGDGSRAFYSVARYEGYITFGEEDIYELDIVTNPSQLPDIKLSGTINLEDMKDLDSTTAISATDTITKKLANKTKPDLITGKYEMSLRPGDYEIKFTAKNYKTETKYISLPKVKRPTPVRMNAPLIPELIKQNKYVKIKNIYFDYNKSTLNREAMIAIENLYSTMNENPGLYVEIIGHTDSRGTDEYNKNLSIARSRSVIDYLVNKGIEPTRFVSKGEGKNALLAKDKTDKGTLNEAGARLNRRVEVRVLKSDQNIIVASDNNIPYDLQINKYNRYSIALKESKEFIATSAFDTIRHAFPTILRLFSPNGYLYYVGDYKDQAEASKALNFAISRGFDDAKIIDYFFLNKLNNFDIINNNPSAKKYTIQLKAIDKKTIMDAKNNPNIKEMKSQDGYYRYFYKEFNSLKEAEIELNNLVEQGYTDAFILDMQNIK